MKLTLFEENMVKLKEFSCYIIPHLISDNRIPKKIRAYDYYQDNLYFVTSCVQHRVCGFGKIVSPKMILNESGKIAEKQWHWLSEQYPYIRLHELVVMPNHIHGSIKINRSVMGTVYTPPDKKIKIKSLSELMGAFKTTTSKQIYLIGYKSTYILLYQISIHCSKFIKSRKNKTEQFVKVS